VAEPDVCKYFGLAAGSTVYRARGCPACDRKGLKGRIGIYEVMKMTGDLRRMVGRGALAEEIHAAAVSAGMIDLKRYAALLLVEGLTTVDEVASVVSVES
jgi:type II secretory ATPase GspE/PulE/Tfp pilus assembly ATPase PilB-like protein